MVYEKSYDFPSNAFATDWLEFFVRETQRYQIRAVEISIDGERLTGVRLEFEALIFEGGDE